MGTRGAGGGSATGRDRREGTPIRPAPPGPLRPRHVRGQDGTRCRRAVAVEERPERALRGGERPPGRPRSALLYHRTGQGRGRLSRLRLPRTFWDRAPTCPLAVRPRLPRRSRGCSAARDRALPLRWLLASCGAGAAGSEPARRLCPVGVLLV